MTPQNPPQPAPATRQDFMVEVERSLRDRSELDASERETILRHCRDAFDQAQAENPTIGGPATTHAEVFESLRRDNVLSETEVARLNERFASLDQIMHSDIARMAMQFNRLQQEAGAEQANRWLAEQLQHQP